MNYNSFSLNGSWEMQYQKDAYLKTDVPNFSGTVVPNAVPNYWEDMIGEPFLNTEINPDYTVLQYPIKETAPDMALPNILGNYFYKRIVTFDESLTNLVISFSGVQNAVSVWINGTYIGRHQGYSVPFCMEIPDGVVVKGDNIVVLSVSNHRLLGYADEPISGLTSRAANECTGGITGDVEIRQYICPLVDVSVVISPDIKRATANVVTKEETEFSWAVKDNDTVLKTGKANGDFSFDTTGLELWSPENPKLYNLELSCEGGSIKTTFGVRRITTEGHKIKLNGKPYYLRGICEHCYFPETVHPIHDVKFYEDVITKIKELGFNFIRFHTYVPYEEYLEAADRLGMLVQVESPNNTTVSEWEEIVEFAKHHTSVVIYCCGNELMIDEPFIEHLRACSEVVHKNTDSLFSPLSALRGLEYFLIDPEIQDDLINEPFQHHPKRFSVVGEFADVYNSYANSYLSYNSLKADPHMLDSRAEVYQKPRLSHEICIDGTYTDLSLKDRYVGTRVGNTDMFSSLERHLKEKGILHKAPLYFKNSCQWQRRVRKYCFEATRRCNTIYGYDFLGPIDTHWHTFGYDVGMMNEFYELKPGETVENVLRYNSPTVLLTDIMQNTNILSGETFSFKVFASFFETQQVKNPKLTVKISHKDDVIYEETVDVDNLVLGEVTEIHDVSFKMPQTDVVKELILTATLDGEREIASNCWELYLFPKTTSEIKDLVVSEGMEQEQLIDALDQGKKVVLLGGKPFSCLETSFRIALAGRTKGNLATVVNSHPICDAIPNDGYCGWQFAKLLNDGNAVCFNTDNVPFNPIIEVVSTHKYAIRQAALFEFNVGKGKLLVCSFNFKTDDVSAKWLKNNIISYANSDKFDPKDSITKEQLLDLINDTVENLGGNTNFAFNPNDKTATRKNK